MCLFFTRTQKYRAINESVNPEKGNGVLLSFKVKLCDKIMKMTTVQNESSHKSVFSKAINMIEIPFSYLIFNIMKISLPSTVLESK